MYEVLLVDDEEIFLEYMQQAIDWPAYDCRICASHTNGLKALEYIITNRPDIVFLDINIPNMDGIEVCEKIRAAGLDTSIVITTAHDEFSFAYKAIKMDIVDYMLKPFTTQELEDVLQKVLKRLPSKDFSFHSSETAKPKKMKEQWLLQQIEYYIAAHYTETDLTIGKKAEALRFENSYLRRIYKRATGITITQKIEMLRIQQAKELLESGSYSNREIAERVGYSDQYYFSKRFKQLCQDTPTDYRKKN